MEQDFANTKHGFCPCVPTASLCGLTVCLSLSAGPFFFFMRLHNQPRNTSLRGPLPIVIFHQIAILLATPPPQRLFQMPDENLRTYYIAVALAIAALLTGIIAFTFGANILILKLLFPTLCLLFILLLLTSRGRYS